MPTIPEIQCCINNLNSCSDVTEMAVLAAETYAATNDRSINVATVNDLPDLSISNISSGTVFFVDSIGVPVVASNGCWTGLDNRLLRRDVTINEIWSWGYNGLGQLGDNTTTNRSSPVTVVGGFTDWCQVSTNQIHSTALRQDGTIWTWGGNDRGQLGDNTSVSKSSPVSVVGGFTDWCQIDAGGASNIGLRIDGTAWTWGWNLNGRLGDNTTTNRSSPVTVVGGFTDWKSVALGFDTAGGIRHNGTIWTWGYNFGQLGDNTSVNKSSPVSVVGGFTDWCVLSIGYGHSHAIRENGTMWAWGFGSAGRLGDNTTTNKSSPVSVVGGFTDWCQIGVGCRHSLGIRNNGTLWSWGCNGDGRLGDGFTVDKSSPVSVVGGFTDWCQASAGVCHSVGIRQNGTAWAWGHNDTGRLGDNTVTNRSSPVSVVGGFTDWCQVSAGGYSSIGIRTI